MANEATPITIRIATLEARQSELMNKLQHCVPPVDQHRRELERVRSDLSTLRAEGDEGSGGHHEPPNAGGVVDRDRPDD